MDELPVGRAEQRMVQTLQDVREAIVIASKFLYSPWTREEDALLMSLFSEYGARWKCIARHFTGRTGDGLRQRHNRITRHTSEPHTRTHARARQRVWNAADTLKLLESVEYCDVEKFKALVKAHSGVSGIRHKRDRLLTKGKFPKFDTESWKFLVKHAVE